MDFAKRFIQASAVKFGRPEKQRAENRKRGGHPHHQMEMPGDEIVGDRGDCDVMPREE